MKLNLNKENIIMVLKNKIMLHKSNVNNYRNYFNTEYSHLRLTHDLYDRHYYHNTSEVSEYGMIEEFKSHRR